MSGSRFWFKFYPRDLLGNPVIATLPIETRWVLIELMCFAHEQPSPGRIEKEALEGWLVGYLAGRLPGGLSQAREALTCLVARQVTRQGTCGAITLRRMHADASRREAGRVARLKRGDLAGQGAGTPAGTLPAIEARKPDETEKGASPPAPSKPRKKRKPAESHVEVLERPAYSVLKAHAGFMGAWKRWIEWTETEGARARTPKGPQAATLLNLAVKHGPDLAVRAIEDAIAADWKSWNPTWVRTNGRATPPPVVGASNARRDFDAEQAQRNRAMLLGQEG